jgi:predicted ATPase
VKIALIGSHGTGKTTLCFDLAARLKRLDLSVDIVKEVARRCPLPLNRDTTLAAQQWILHQQIADELAATEQFEAVVCDRSVLDNYAYLVLGVGRRDELEPMVAEWMRTYDGLYKVPILHAPTWDGTRDLSEEFQGDIDHQIDELLVRFGVRCERLDPARRERWPEEVLQLAGLPARRPQIGLFDGFGFGD